MCFKGDQSCYEITTEGHFMEAESLCTVTLFCIPVNGLTCSSQHWANNNQDNTILVSILNCAVLSCFLGMFNNLQDIQNVYLSRVLVALHTNILKS